MTHTAQATNQQDSFGPLELLLGFFSSVRLGIVLLILLFVYSWVGSAGFWLPGHLPTAANHAWMHDIYWIIPWTQLHVRQSPWIEQTEFEWFHWWPFLVLMGLLCTNVTVTTLRRIPFKPVNYGVWMIHAGVILLTLTCAWYFIAKVEGDILLPRKRVHVQLPTGETGSMTCKIGGSITLGKGDARTTFTVSRIDPRWEILSGDDKGARTYTAYITVERNGERYDRQILAGYPEYSEDIIPSKNPGKPFERLVNLTGERLKDPELQVWFGDEIRDTFYLRDSAALYVREVGETRWHERPIAKLPRYHDHVSDRDNVWPTADPTIQDGSLDITIPPHTETDEAAGLPDVTITDVLQYAVPDQNFIDGPANGSLNPAIVVQLEAASQQAEYQLLAFDPMRSSAENGRLAFRWLDDEHDLERMTSPARVHIAIDDASFEVTHDINAGATEAIELGETGYSYRVESVENNLALDAQTRVSVAMVVITTPDGRAFRRWVFDDPQRNRDMPLELAGPDPTQPAFLDENITMRYEPGGAPAIVTLLAGPEPRQLRLLLSLPGQEPRIEPAPLHTAIPLDRGVTLGIRRYSPNAVFATKPFIVPRSQRNRDVGQQLAMIGVTVPGAAPQKTYWLPFHLYPFTSEDQAMRRFPYRPARVLLEDGREIELLFSRKSHPLPYQITLDDFRVIEHVGGFTGATNSVRDWNSILRFREDPQASWSDTSAVAMNKPVTRGEWSFFQAQWDPPDPPNSAGLNYTVLGVGNRHGVNAMLASSTLIVIGLIYAFYVKPLIRRRQQRDVIAAAAAGKAGASPDAPTAARPANTSAGTGDDQPHSLAGVGAGGSNTQEGQSS